MKKNLLSMLAMAVLMVFAAAGYAQTTYTRVNSASELEAGAQYILVGFNNDGAAFVMSYQKNNNRHAIAIDENGGTITTVVAANASSQTEAFEFTLGGSAGQWTIYDPLNDGYLYAAGGGNYLKTQSTLDDKGKWTINDGEEGGMVPVSNGGVDQCYMRYNITSTLFGCYTSSSSVIATVYFYKAGGAPVIYPEPSNYPTSFTAAVNNMDVTLTWTDATGAQLPSRYLVLASKGNITVPTDGTPVVDGELAKNVNYGAQTVTFSGLESGATYHFAIFPYTNNGANIDFKTDGTYPTANATTESFFLFEGFDNELGQFSQYSVLGDDKVWHQATHQASGTTYALMNGFVGSGVYEESEDWLISPQRFVPAGATFINLEFRNAKKFDGNQLQVMVSGDYSGQGDPNNADWVDITDAFDFSLGDYEWVESGQVNILPELGNASHFYVAFLYTCTVDAGSAWEVDWVKMTADGAVSVNESNIANLNVYPNPANNVISFNLASDAQVSVFDITGRMINTMNMAAGQGQCQVRDLENGVYFLNVRYADGKQEVVRFVKF